MNILIVSQYFWPENFRINEISKFLAKKGYNVDIYTTYPNYPFKDVFKNTNYNDKNFTKILILFGYHLFLEVREIH